MVGIYHVGQNLDAAPRVHDSRRRIDINDIRKYNIDRKEKERCRKST